MKVVVTGMGVVSPIGIGVEAFWQALCRGHSGVGEITRFDTREFAFRQAGEVKDFLCPDDRLRGVDSMDLASQFMMAAASEAMADARLSDTGDWRGDGGVVLGTNFGGILSGEALLGRLHNERGAAPAAPFSEYSFQRCADHVARRWGMEGPRVTLSLSCSSGTAALGYGLDLIRSGRANVVVTGGYDALSRFCWSGLSALRTMSRSRIRPFDLNRDGTIFSEGAGAIVIEALDHARARGAGIQAELAGWGANNNAHHMTAPSRGGRGTAAVMVMALRDAGLDAAGIDHINVHGTGTKYNDVTETQAIKTVFGQRAYGIPLTATKSMTGHMMGAAGSVEAIASVLSIRHGTIPPTINFETPDPECDLDCVFGKQREVRLDSVLSTSAGIGGCNAAVVLRRGES